MAPCIYLCPVIRERRLGLCQQRPTCSSVLTRPAYLLLPERSRHSSVPWLCFFLCVFFKPLILVMTSTLHHHQADMWKPQCPCVVGLCRHCLLPPSLLNHVWYRFWRHCVLSRNYRGRFFSYHLFTGNRSPAAIWHVCVASLNWKRICRSIFNLSRHKHRPCLSGALTFVSCWQSLRNDFCKYNSLRMYFT